MLVDQLEPILKLIHKWQILKRVPTECLYWDWFSGWGLISWNMTNQLRLCLAKLENFTIILFTLSKELVETIGLEQGLYHGKACIMFRNFYYYLDVSKLIILRDTAWNCVHTLKYLLDLYNYFRCFEHLITTIA